MTDIKITKVPQGQVVIAPNGDKKADSCDTTAVFGTIPGERGSPAHNTSDALSDEQGSCDY